MHAAGGSITQLRVWHTVIRLLDIAWESRRMIDSYSFIALFSRQTRDRLRAILICVSQASCGRLTAGCRAAYTRNEDGTTTGIKCRKTCYRKHFYSSLTHFSRRFTTVKESTNLIVSTVIFCLTLVVVC